MKIVMDYEKKEHSIMFTATEIRNKDLTGLDIELLVNIIAYMDVNTRIAKPSQQLLADNMGISTSTISKRIKKLLENFPNIIVRELVGMAGGIGYEKHSEYNLNIDVEIATATKKLKTAYFIPSKEEQLEQEDYEKMCAEWLTTQEEV